MHVTYEQWMTRTKLGLLSPRSKTLEKLDKEFRQYDAVPSQLHLRKLKKAFEEWKTLKGQTWRQSERNHKGAVTDLDAMLTGPPADLAPVDYLLQEQKRSIENLFRGRKLAAKNMKIATTSLGVVTKVENVRRAADALGIDTIIKKAMVEMFGNAAEGTVETQIAQFFGDRFLPEFMQSLVPYAGILTTGAGAVRQWVKLAQSQYRIGVVHDCENAVRAGDARAAVAAIDRILRQDVRDHVRGGLLLTFETIGRGAAAGTAGPGAELMVAGAMAIGRLMNQIYEVGRAYREATAGNQILLGAQPITYTVFDKHPLLGCYYIVCTDTSNVVNFMLNDIGTEDWMTEVEELNPQVQKIVEVARKVIGDAYYEIPHMPKIRKSTEFSFKGVTKDLAFKAKSARAAIPIG